MKRLTILIALSVLVFTFVAMLVPRQTYASDPFSGAANQACGGVALNGSTNSCPDSSGTLNKTLIVGLNIFSLIIGIIAVIMIMIGGLKFITSSGDSAATNSARNTILYAIVGLVVVSLAQVIVHFVLKRIP